MRESTLFYSVLLLQLLIFAGLIQPAIVSGQQYRNNQNISFDLTGYKSSPDPFLSSNIYEKDNHYVYVKKPSHEIKNAWKDLVLSRLKSPSRPVFAEEDRYFRFIPQFKASLKPTSNNATWSSKCFKQLEAKLDIFQRDVILHIDAKDGAWLCADAYLICDREGFYFRLIYMSGSHTLEFKGLSDTELKDIVQHGLHIFYLPDGILGSIQDIFATLLLFIGPWTQEENIRFVEGHFNTTFTLRKNTIAHIDKNQLQNGDYLAIRTWDGADPLIMIGTGSHTGHAAVVLKIDGEPYVVESTALKPNWPPPYGIIAHKWDEWVQLAYKANMDVVIFHLSKEMQAKWNQTAALEFWNSVKGLPYGYHNFFFGWIDTVADNYPPPLDRHFLLFIMLLFEKIEPEMATSMYTLALNKRLGTEGLSMREILDECDRRNIDLLELMAVPEQDSWVYPDGKSMVCDVFVLGLYKAAGLFGNIADQIQVTEFHPRDSYELNFYDTSSPLCTPEKGQPFCQLMGNTILELPRFNTLTPYPHMNEKCGAMPPNYNRFPEKC